MKKTTNPMEDIFDQIKNIVCEKTGVRESALSRETRLYEDLKIDGDDAFELLQTFMSRFNVDMRDFKYDEYFAAEGIDLIGAFLTIFKRNKKKLKSLTLGDLEQAAKERKWVTQIR